MLAVATASISPAAGQELCSYRLLLVAFETCSSKAVIAEEDHHPIILGGVKLGRYQEKVIDAGRVKCRRVVEARRYLW